jgi:hypothetical protein
MVKHNFQKGFVHVVTLIRIILIMLHLSSPFEPCRALIFFVCHPLSYSDECSFGFQIVFAIGFVSVDEKSVARNSHDGPGDKLEQLILRFCKANSKLVVQDTHLKAVIESKLNVKCRTGDQAVEEVIWGLKYVMPCFVLEEANKVPYNYILPMSEQVLQDLETYGINVSTSEVFCSPCYCNAILYSDTVDIS